MRKREEVTETKVTTRTRTFCDRCGAEKRVYRCQICGKDVCRKCGDDYDPDYLTPGSYDGDYPDLVCKRCWEIGKSFIEEIKRIEEEAGRKVEVLMDRWIEEAKKDWEHGMVM